jgi:hypothetical protein
VLIVNFEERWDDDINKTLPSCKALDNINDWLRHGDFGKLDELSKHVTSGGKNMPCHLYGGAFNFLKIDEFVSLVLSQDWKVPESVMLLIKDEEEDVFTVNKVA